MHGNIGINIFSEPERTYPSKGGSERHQEEVAIPGVYEQVNQMGQKLALVRARGLLEEREQVEHDHNPLMAMMRGHMSGARGI